MASYVVSTKQEQNEMLEEIGLEKLDDLFSVVKQSNSRDLNLNKGLSEMETKVEVERLADNNKQFEHIFAGGGVYNHYIPAIVKEITNKKEFVTAYTPYQPEISQGVLQSIFEYQTQMCELTGMDASNASVYDGAVAASEAIFMCINKDQHKILVASCLNPEVKCVLETYCTSRDVEVIYLASKMGKVDIEDLKTKLSEEVAAVLIQSPNYYGIIENVNEISEVVHNYKCKIILHSNPITYALLKSGSEQNVDICTGEGQPLGLPMSYGGPYLGYMTCKQELIRKLPGRIVGQTEDTDHNRCYVLTLQAREQHIRREKASSNVCSNEALCALTASVYLAALGPKGLVKVAENAVSNAHYLATQLSELGFKLRYNSEFFNEFLMDSPVVSSDLYYCLLAKGYLPGILCDGGILWCCTEMNDKAEIDKLVRTIKEVL